MLTRFKSPSALLSLSLMVAGCTMGEEGAAPTIDERAQSLGFVSIERASADSAEPTNGRAILGAAFARYEGVDGQEVLGLLGDSPAALDVDSCAIAEAEEVTITEPDASVELLDAGPIDVHVAGGSARVSSSTFPELDSLVAGVFYGGSVQLPVSEAETDEYRVQASGGQGLSAFDVLTVAPLGFSDLVFAGVAPSALPNARRVSDTEIGWDAGDPGDRVEIEVSAAGRTLECVAADDGSFRIRADLLAQLEPDQNARVTLRRVHREPFDVVGLDASWVRIATTRTFPIIVR